MSNGADKGGSSALSSAAFSSDGDGDTSLAGLTSSNPIGRRKGDGWFGDGSPSLESNSSAGDPGAEHWKFTEKPSVNPSEFFPFRRNSSLPFPFFS